MNDTLPEHPALHIDEARLRRLQAWAEIAPQSAEEDAYLRRELNSQLVRMVVKVLDPKLDDALAAITPAAYGVDLPPRCAPMREDEVEPWPDADALLDAAPRIRDRYFVVPAGRHGDL